MSVEITLRDYKEIMPLELLTNEDKSRYFERAKWSWVQAIYILQGYKPPEIFEFENENAKYHFPNETIVFGESRNYLSAGCKVTNAGITTYYDSPKNWQVFWRVHYPQLFVQIDTPPTDIEPTENKTHTAPPVQDDVEPSTYQLRNDDFKAWIEEDPTLDKMTKLEIHNHLKVRNPQLWLYIETKGFDTWWQQNPHYKAKRGRKKCTQKNYHTSKTLKT
jgi:hypothetical protein